MGCAEGVDRSLEARDELSAKRARELEERADDLWPAVGAIGGNTREDEAGVPR